MAVPTWVPGQILTASDVNTWFVPITRIKPGDTARASTTTFANDPDLILPVAANSTYFVQAVLFYTGAATMGSGFKYTFTVPTSATGMHGDSYQNSSNIYVGDIAYNWTDTPQPQGGAWTDGVTSFLNVKISGILVVAGTAGNLTLQWAQFTSSATNTTLRANSFLAASRIS